MAGGGGEFQKPLPRGWTEGTMGPGSPEPVRCLGSADGSSGQSERQERRSGAPGKPLRAGGEAREENPLHTHTAPLPLGLIHHPAPSCVSCHPRKIYISGHRGQVVC